MEQRHTIVCIANVPEKLITIINHHLCISEKSMPLKNTEIKHRCDSRKLSVTVSDFADMCCILYSNFLRIYVI